MINGISPQMEEAYAKIPGNDKLKVDLLEDSEKKKRIEETHFGERQKYFLALGIVMGKIGRLMIDLSNDNKAQMTLLLGYLALGITSATYTCNSGVGVISTTNFAYTLEVNSTGLINMKTCINQTDLSKVNCTRMCNSGICPSDCACSSNNYTEVISCLVNNVKIPCWNCSEQTSHVIIHASRSLLAVGDPQGYISINGHDITFNLLNYNSGTLLGTCEKGQLRYNLLLNNQTMVMHIDPIAFQISGSIYCEVRDLSNSNNLIVSNSFMVVGEVLCPLSDCLLCDKLWKSYYCVPNALRQAMIGIIVIIVLLILIIAPILLKWLYYLLKFIILLIFTCCAYGQKSKKVIKYKYNIIREKAKNKIDNFMNVPDDEKMDIEENNQNDSIMMESQTDRKVTKNTNNSFIKSPFNFKTLSIMFLMCISFENITVKACDINFSVGSDVITCLNNGNGEICSVVTNFILPFSYTGQTLCYHMVSNDIVQHTIELQYRTMDKIMVMNTEYYTRDWELSTKSIHACAGTSICPDSLNNCRSCNDRTCSGVFDINDVNSPGGQECSNSCSCASCNGCFLCTPTCLYCEYTLRAIGDTLTVNSISSLKLNPILILNVKNSTGNIIWSEILVYGAPLFVPQINTTFSVQGSLSGDITQYPKMMIQYGNDYYYGQASLQGQPTQQNIGDIQSSSSSNFDNFIYDLTMVSVSKQSYTCTYTVPQSGFDGSFSTLQKIPFTMNDEEWYRNINNEIAIRNNNHGGLNVLMQVNGYKIKLQTTLSCGKIIEITNVSSCFNCPLSSHMLVTINNNCAKGSASLSTTANNIIIQNISIQLDVGQKIYDVFFKSSSNFSTGQLCLQDTGKSCLDVTIRSSEYNPNIRNDSTNETRTVLDSIKDWFSNLNKNIVEGIQNLFKSDSVVANIISIIIYIAIGIIIVILVIVIIVYLRKCCNNKVKEKSN